MPGYSKIYFMKTFFFGNFILPCLVAVLMSASPVAEKNSGNAAEALDKIGQLRTKIKEMHRTVDHLYNNFSSMDIYRQEMVKLISILESTRDLALNAEKQIADFNNEVSKNKNKDVINYAGEAKADASEMYTEINRLLRKTNDAKAADSPDEAKVFLKKIITILNDIGNLLNTSENYIQKSQKLMESSR
jgi:hypothetical protein